MNNESIPSSEPAKDYMQFDKYIIETRNEFVRKFWDMYPNSEKRVVAEDLLICFDQMRERLYQYSQPASQPEPAKESQPVYGIRWESEKSPEKPGKYYCGVKVDGDFEKHIIDWDGNSWGCIEDYDRYDDLEIIEWLHEKAVIAPAPQPEPSESLTAVDYEEVLADHRRLVRELDQIINGNDAATQGSLVDIVAQIRDLWFPSPPSEVNSDDLPHDVGEWATDFIGMEELWKEFSVETTEEDIPGSLVLFKYQFSIVMEKVMTAVRADRKRHADLTAKSSPPSVKPEREEMSLDTELPGTHWGKGSGAELYLNEPSPAVQQEDGEVPEEIRQSIRQAASIEAQKWCATGIEDWLEGFEVGGAYTYHKMQEEIEIRGHQINDLREENKDLQSRLTASRYVTDKTMAQLSEKETEAADYRNALIKIEILGTAVESPGVFESGRGWEATKNKYAEIAWAARVKYIQQTPTK